MLPRATKKNLYICIFEIKKLESSTPIILDGDSNCAVILTFDRKCDSEKKTTSRNMTSFEFRRLLKLH